MWIIKIFKIQCFYPNRIINEHRCIYSCLQIPPRENWFHSVRRVHATAINFPCIITLIKIRYYYTSTWYLLTIRLTRTPQSIPIFIWTPFTLDCQYLGTPCTLDCLYIGTPFNLDGLYIGTPFTPDGLFIGTPFTLDCLYI